MNDYVQWVKRAETAEAEAVRLTLEVERLKRALNDLAEAAEVAAQGGIHGARGRWDNGAMTDAVTELLWAELDRYLPDGAIHPHAMRAIAYQIVQLMAARIDG